RALQARGWHLKRFTGRLVRIELLVDANLRGVFSMTRLSRSSIRALTRGSIALVVMLASTLIAVVPAGAQSAGWQPGPGAILDNTYDGYIDTPTSSTAL